MKCNTQTQDQIVSLSLGELSPLKGWLLRRHIATCPKCQAKWRQTHDVSALLQSIAVAPVPDKALHITDFGAFPALEPQEAPAALRKEIPQMRRLKFVVAGLAMLLLVAGGVTAQLFQFKPSGGFSDPQGRTWMIVTDFKGEIQGLNPQNGLMGTLLMDTGDPNKGTADLTVDGRSYHFQGPGRYEVHDSKNVLIGYLVLDPAPKPHNWRTVPAVSGVTTTPYGVKGFDRNLGLTWSLRGAGAVTVTDATGKQMAHATPQRLHGDAANQAQPELTATVNEATITEKGYGDHPLKDKTGKVIVVLTVTPLQR